MNRITIPNYKQVLYFKVPAKNVYLIAYFILFKKKGHVRSDPPQPQHRLYNLLQMVYRLYNYYYYYRPSAVAIEKLINLKKNITVLNLKSLLYTIFVTSRILCMGSRVGY